MISQKQADALAESWIDAWNAHDLDAVMRHYSPRVEFVSPIAARLLERDDGAIHGEADLREYFQRGLARFPDLHLELLHVMPGVNSVVLIYHSLHNLLAAEVLELEGPQEGEPPRILRAHGHYSPA